MARERIGVCGAAAALVAMLAAPAAAHDQVEIGVGMLGHVGGVFIDKPDDQNVDGEADIKPNYPGFAGSSTGFGGMIDIRFFRYAGIELDFIYQTDNGEADLTITNLATGQETVFVVELFHDGWHVPLLFKGVLPGEYVQPMLMLGPEFVLPDEPGLNIIEGDNTTVTEYSGFEDGMYTMFTFGFGLEIKLPFPTDDVSVRIPISARGSFNPGVENNRADREDTDIDKATDPITVKEIRYKTEWQFQASANFGASLHF